MLRGELGNRVGLVGQVADHPGVVHAVARRRALRVIEAGGNADGVVLSHLDDLLAQLRVAVALRLGEAIVIDLGLRMMMRRIARPAAGKRHDFAEHQLDFGRRVAAIEDRAHVAQRALADLAACRGARSAPAAGVNTRGAKLAAVGAVIDGQFAVAARLDLDARARRRRARSSPIRRTASGARTRTAARRPCPRTRAAHQQPGGFRCACDVAASRRPRSRSTASPIARRIVRASSATRDAVKPAPKPPR